MKRWCYDDQDDNQVFKTEQEILDEFYDYWEEMMIKKYGKDHYLINPQNCIDDWIITHYAYDPDSAPVVQR